MFLSHIAWSLELISLAIGALLVLKCCVSCHYSRFVSEPRVTDSSGEHIRKTKHFGFLKFIGYFVIILSFLGLICTTISYMSYLGKYGFEEVYFEYQLKNPYPNDPKLAPYHKDAPVAPHTKAP